MTLKHVTISAIAAMAQNRVIGGGNKMLWHIPDDFKNYKKITMGKPLIMGRKTFESILAFNGKPLSGRTSIVVSRGGFECEGALVFPSLEEALVQAKEIAARDGVDEIFINGGGQIYSAALPYVERLYLTVIHRDYEGDTFFPELNPDEWLEISCAECPDNNPPYAIKVLKRSSL